jgi:hypothetical protein
MAANARHGGTFFDRELMRRMGMRLGERVHGGRYFLTSAVYLTRDGGRERLWTVRAVGEGGEVSTVATKPRFLASADHALAQIRVLLRGAAGAAA